MTNPETTQTVSIFDRMYNATEEALKAIGKPLVKRRLKSVAESYYHDAAGKALDAGAKYAEITKNISRLDAESFEELMRNAQLLEKYSALANKTAEQYKILFGEELAPIDMSVEQFIC